MTGNRTAGTANRKRKPKPVIQEIRIDPAGKYIILCNGLIDAQVVVLREMLQNFYNNPEMPFFLMNVDERVTLKVTRVK